MNGRWLAAVTLGVAILTPLPAAAQETGGGAGRAGSFGNAGVNDQTGTARSSDPNPGSGGITRDGAGVLSDKPKTHGASGPGTTGRETSPGTTNDE
ncbi:hypothetical protein [Methylorubrum rhodesianum]|uniref:hypothetical protein n=1 Tax=Methylorubrum rhodesianum TaxID=29427 RepID=UPI0037476EBD